MNDYTVVMAYDQFTITTVIYADSEEEAMRLAMQKMTQDEGLPLDYPQGWEITLEGEFVNG